MANPAGRSSVEIVADLRKFGDQLERDLNRELRGVDVDASPVTEQMTEQVEDAVDSMLRTFGKLPAGAHPAFQVVAESAEQMVEEIDSELEQVDTKIEEVERSIRELAREFARTGDQEIFKKLRADRTTLANLRAVRAEIDEIGDEARATARALDEVGDQARQASSAGSVGFTEFGKVLMTLGGSLASLGAGGLSPQGIILFATAIAGLAVATPVVIALSAALADLVGLLPALPAAAAVGGAAFATLKVAMMGVSDAFEAIMEGDPEKVAEALKKLAPAARSVAKEFKALLPDLRGTQKSIQESFFVPLKGSLTELVTKLLPPVRGGMADVGFEMGKLGAQLVNFITAPKTIAFINEAFATLSRILQDAGPGLQAIVDIITTLGMAGLPLIEKFAGFLGDGAVALSEFLAGAAESGALQDFLDDALATLGELWDLGKALFGLLGALFGGADDEGRSFLQTLTDIVNQMTEFLKSSEGQEFLQNLMDLLPVATFMLQQFATSMGVLALAVNEVSAFWGTMINFWQAAPGVIASVAEAVGGFFVDAWNTASAAVVRFFTGVARFFTELPGRLLGWITAAGAALVGGLKFALESGLRTVGMGIGLILFAITQLPGMIMRALINLPGMIASLFRTVWNGARNLTTAAFNAIVAAGAAFISRAIAVLRALPGRVATIFRTMTSTALSLARSGFNAIINFIAGAPGRLSALGGRFLTAGRRIITSFFNGLRAAGSMASDVGGAIVRSVRSGLNRVIGSINSGIASIDRVLPGSLPRIPYLAKGGMTTGLTAAVLSEFGQREVVVPIDDPRTMAALREALGTGGSAITLMPGAVVVEIHGPVTEDEARAAGAAAGQGFLDTIDRRDGRMAVRTL